MRFVGSSIGCCHRSTTDGKAKTIRTWLVAAAHSSNRWEKITRRKKFGVVPQIGNKMERKNQAAVVGYQR